MSPGWVPGGICSVVNPSTVLTCLHARTSINWSCKIYERGRGAKKGKNKIQTNSKPTGLYSQSGSRNRIPFESSEGNDKTFGPKSVEAHQESKHSEASIVMTLC